MNVNSKHRRVSEGSPRRWRGSGALLFAGFVLAGCSGESPPAESTDADTLTRRQKDSLLSTMPIPGAGAVGKALDAADKAEERARQHDTLG